MVFQFLGQLFTSTATPVSLGVTNATMPCPFRSSGLPTTAASATAGWLTKALSISIVPSRCPETLITSSTRPLIQKTAVLIAMGPIAGEIACREFGPIPFAITIRIAVNSAQHCRPRVTNDEIAALVRPTAFALLVNHIRHDAGKGRVAEPGLSCVTPGTGEIMMAPVSVCHQVSTIGQRPRPIFCDTTSRLPD